MSDNRGFTLIEILIALGIGLTAIAAIYAMINLAQKSTTGMERRFAAQQDEKAALELMSMEIRMASFNPNFTSGNWVAKDDNDFDNSDYCSTASPNQNYVGIQEATATSITVEMDMNENCTVNNNPACMSTDDNPNEVIRYNYDVVNLYITRETNCGGAQPFLGDTAASGRTRAVRVINNAFNPVIPIFRYFNGKGIEIAAPVTASIPDIKRVLITLAVETEKTDLNTGQRKKMIYSTSVIVRNHAPMPGI
jgi:prepilin-type N-terminal cleavage/methylation domain-containing protein